MNLSDLKKLISKEEKIIMMTESGEVVAVVMSFDEYKRLKEGQREKESASHEPLPLNFQPIGFKEAAFEGGEPQPDLSGREKESEKPSENPSQDLTLDDLPF